MQSFQDLSSHAAFAGHASARALPTNRKDCSGGTLHSAIMIYQQTEAQDLSRIFRTRSMYAFAGWGASGSWSKSYPMSKREPSPSEDYTSCTIRSATDWFAATGKNFKCTTPLSLIALL
jgi:hypothetical protein